MDDLITKTKQQKCSQSLENMLREKQKELKIKFSHIMVKSRGNSPQIETLLLQKNSESQKKITEMRQKQYANELKELRQVPKINKISQKIAKTKEKYEFLTIPKNTNQILKTFRQSTSNTPYPLQSYIKVTDLLNESSVTERKSDSVAKLSVFYENRSENNNKSLIKDDFELRKVSVNDFLSAMVNRSCIFDEKKRLDLLNMTVIRRNHYWLEEKNRKIEEKKEEKAKLEFELCTFSPKILPKSRFYEDTRQVQSKRQFYSIKYNQQYSPSKLKKKNYPKVVKKQEINKPVMKYKPISPYFTKFCKETGSNLLKNAVSVVSYKT